ncbi:MAG: DNA/RNA nuclease SfsA [Caldicoprobacterales bacterium]|jgi:sugar fermentation stimulation protein
MNILYYPDMVSGIFLKRPNRFIAHVLVNGQEETAHVKNTGRCRELLIPGAAVYLQKHNNPDRKTKFSLIAVEKGDLLVNMDSQAPNKVMLEGLKQGISLPGMEAPYTQIRQEAVYGSSRFDFFVTNGEKEAYLEIKGVTLEIDGAAKFPDAPTERGVKHIRELILAAEEGFLAYVVFIAQMKGIRYVTPNDDMHPEFGRAIREAKEAGVQIIAYDCLVSPEKMELDKPLTVVL